MALNDRLVAGAQVAVTIDGVTAGNAAAGPTLIMNKVKKGTLSGLLTVDAETNTITLTPLWQVSVDSTTWRDVYPENGAAYVIMATGTAGADAAVTRCIVAPAAAYGWRYARLSISVGVVDGEVADSSSVGYNYQNDTIV